MKKHTILKYIDEVTFFFIINTNRNGSDKMKEQLIAQAIKEKISEELNRRKKTDPFFYIELEKIYELLKNAPTVDKYSTGLQGTLGYHSKQENIALVSEFLRRCNKEYAETFQNANKQNKIEFDPTKENSCSGNIHTKEYKINIRRTNTIQDAKHIVHEFFHSLNLNNFAIRQAFTEAVSIAAERQFLDFLVEKGISTYDINILKEERNIIYRDNLDYLIKILPFFIKVKKDLNKGERELKTKAEEELLIKYQQSIEEGIELGYIDTYRHTLGFIYMSNFHQQGNKEPDLVKLNQCLNENNLQTLEQIMLGENSDYPMMDYVRQELQNDMKSLVKKK